jgi:3-phosphoshikimate 1-carboxyvinyltransferase
VIRRVVGAGPLRGRLRVPGDKSISHRALILNALATGQARVTGLLDAADVRSTAACLRALGVSIEVERDSDGDNDSDSGSDTVVVTGCGGQLTEPGEVLDCGNAGTTMRLLAGVLAGQAFHSVLTGDASLRTRPMGRIVGPLRALGASLDGRQGGALAPLAIRGGRPLSGARITVPVASAQVKSAILLAGLSAAGPVEVQIGLCRDHTERMLQGMGVPVEVTADGVRLVGPAVPRAADVAVPGDISSAAFWLVAASITPGSDLLLEGVGLNPTRTGVLDVLHRMGANIQVLDAHTVAGEPVGSLRVLAAPLRGVRIEGDEIARLIDEVPVLAVAAAVAEGPTVVADAAELRVKESDRVATTVAFLRAMGADATPRPDGLVVAGSALLHGATVQAGGDHRIAMAAAVAATIAKGPTDIVGAGAADISYPTFFADLERLATAG